LFTYLGIAATSLWFFTIFIKAIAPSALHTGFYYFLWLSLFSSVFWQDTSTDFSIFYMLTLLILYIVSLFHLGYRIFSESHQGLIVREI
jgi:hypothetical protein